MKSSVKIKLNGVLITGRIDGIEAFEITIRENDDQGIIVKSYSSELRFYDDGYNILKPILIDNINGFVNNVNVEVYDECCGRLVFEGVISGDAIDWCEPECWISAQVIEKKPILNCVKSRLIYDNELGFLDRPQKKLRYCVDLRPDWIMGLLFTIYAIFNSIIYLILLPLSLVVVVIQSVAFVICQIVCAIPGTPCNSSTCTGGTWTNPNGAFSEISGWMDDMQDRMIQCQWYHPTALVRDYIQNVCDLCGGLTFKSSILNDPSSPYYNLMLFSAPIRKGYKPSQGQNLLITENLPTETLDTLMNTHLKPLFNAQYWIVGNELIFERKDNFVGSGTWIDAEQLLLDGRIVDNQICFNWIDRERPAFGIYKYTLDGSDLLGNEAGIRYEDIVEWNQPPSDSQSGSLDRTMLSSMSRFRGDKVGPDTLESYDDPFWNTLFGGSIANSKGLLLMNQHMAFNYKFMIWDGEDEDNAKIKSFWGPLPGGPVISPPISWSGGGESFESSGGELDVFSLYNYPMWFREDNAGNLYSEFHYIDNPRLPGTKLFEFSFSFTFDCGQFDSIDFAKDVRIRVGSNIKFGEIKEIKVDFVKRVISVSGIV
jgi:hypothetical protein